MAIQFYPTERIIQLDSFNVSGRDIWTAMVDWSVLGDNLKYGVGMTQIGGVAPVPLYLKLQRGWRIRPKEADGVTVLSGYVDTAEGTTPMTETLLLLPVPWSALLTLPVLFLAFPSTIKF